MVTETKFIVRYAETDQMGIVHHSVYPIWYEAGRTDFIRKAGMPYSEMERRGVMLPLLELNCKFKNFSRYEDEITVKTYIKQLTPTRVVFGYNVYKNGEDRCINQGETMHVWTGRDLKPLNMKKHFSDIYDFISSLGTENGEDI